MNIAQQAYQDGQQYRKANRMQVAGEVLENRVMEEFKHTGLDFQHWQPYRNNWMAGYQSVESEPKEQAPANIANQIPDYNSPVIVPLWKFYEAAKIALAELEAIPHDTPGIDWTYVEQRKQQMQTEIAEFEQRFPDYRREQYERGKPRVGFDAADLAERAHEDWSNDE